MFLIVRPADQARGCSPEPALHPECLPYASAHCPMLNGTATHYRRSPVLAGHPAGRSCTEPSCPCPARDPDQGHASRSGNPADRYEAWMISTTDYRLIARPDAPGVPTGISLDIPIRRKRLLRETALPKDTAQLLKLLRSALDLKGDG